MDIDAYLKRINYDGPRTATSDTLKQLQLAHLYSVPFENLSIHANEPIVLNDDSLFQKIVARQRGGFCYELNGLFAALLRELGFDVRMLSAGVARGDGTYSDEFDHMTLLVTLDERWLADVGFGDSFRVPLKLDYRDEQSDGLRNYKIEGQGEHLVMMQQDQAGDWKPQYRFTLQTHDYPAYEQRCLFQQTSPESHFTKARMCSRAVPGGRLTLSGLRLITTENEKRTERMLDEKEYAEILAQEFGVVMTSPFRKP